MTKRIDKILSELQIASRSECKKMAKQGLITVNDKIIKATDRKIDPEVDILKVNGIQVSYEEYQYILFHKPAGCITATEDRRDKTVMDYLPSDLHRGLTPVGRLDKDTEGLLLITDDGMLNHNLLSPKKHVPKTYYAKINGTPNDQTIEQFKEGVDIGEKDLTKPAELTILATGPESEITLTITEGKFHQVKRMFEAVGMEVAYLKRLSMGTLELDEALEPGEWRFLTDEEVHTLKESN